MLSNCDKESSFYFFCTSFFSGIGILLINFFFSVSLSGILCIVLLLLHVSFENELIFEKELGLLLISEKLIEGSIILLY
jgi:hypothetical protein